MSTETPRAMVTRFLKEAVGWADNGNFEAAIEIAQLAINAYWDADEEEFMAVPDE